MSEPVHLPIPSMPRPCKLELIGPKEHMRVVVNGMELPVVMLTDFRPPTVPGQELFDAGSLHKFVVYGRPEPGYVTLTLMVGTVATRDGAEQAQPEEIAFRRAGLDL